MAANCHLSDTNRTTSAFLQISPKKADLVRSLGCSLDVYENISPSCVLVTLHRKGLRDLLAVRNQV